ncbi:MAG: hypothetical protein J3K34DRAFT_519984 [Monoraphidium minutum]|nr:MAG: hypothetical protein J3K34DRAFT_519984 [Monoraphidium minutum]
MDPPGAGEPAGDRPQLWRDPARQIYTWTRRAKAEGPPEFRVTRLGCGSDPLIAEAPQFVAALRVPGAVDEDTGERIEELEVQGEGPTFSAAKAAAAAAAVEALFRFPLWAKRMAELEPAASLWGTVALALSDVGLHKDLELRNFALLSQQSQAAADSAPEAARAVLPLTLVTHARLVGRWFREHASELGGGGGAEGGRAGAEEGGAPRRGPPPRGGGAVGGDAHLMLRELVERRGWEPEGGNDALLDAGLALVEGGTCIQRLKTYFPPSEQYLVQSEVWDPQAVAVKIPADPGLEMEEMARNLGARSPGRLVVWGKVGCKASWLAGSEQEAAAAAAAGRLVGQRHNRRPRPEPAATTTAAIAAVPGGDASRTVAVGGGGGAAAALGPVFGFPAQLGAAGGGEGDDEPAAKRAARAAPAAPGAAGAEGAAAGGAIAERPERGPPPSLPPARPTAGASSGAAGGGESTGGGATGPGALSVRSLIVEGQGPAAMDWAANGSQEGPQQPPSGAAAAASRPPGGRFGGGGGGFRGRGGRGRGGRFGGGGEGDTGANEIKLSEPTLYSLFHFHAAPGARRGAVGQPPSAAAAGVELEGAAMGGGFGAAAELLGGGGGGGGEEGMGVEGESFEEEGLGGELEGFGGGGGAPRLNVRASWLAGCAVWGDALASLSRMTPTEVGHHLIRWRTFSRRDLDLSLAALFPASAYARGRHLPVTARLPLAFRSMNSWLGPSPCKLLSAYTSHHAWRGREAWETSQPPAPLPPAAGAPGAPEPQGGGGGGAGAPWVARLRVLPFGREEPIEVESEPFLNEWDARHAAALRALHMLEPLDAAALAGATRLPGPPLCAPPPGAAGAGEAAAQVAGEQRAILLDTAAAGGGGPAGATAGGGSVALMGAEPMEGAGGECGGQAGGGGGGGEPPLAMVVEGEGGAAALGRGGAAAAAALGTAAAAPPPPAPAGGGGAGAAAGWGVEVLHPGPEGGRRGEAGLVARFDLRVCVPKGAPPPAAAPQAPASAGAQGLGGGAAAAGGGGGGGGGGGEEEGFVVEQTGLASFQGLSFELGAAAVVAPLEALVMALRPGGRGRVRARLALEGPDPLRLFQERDLVIYATLLSLAPPRPPLAADARGGAEEELGAEAGGGGGGHGGGGRWGRGRGRGRGGRFGGGRGRRGPDALSALFEPPLRSQAAAVAIGLVQAAGARGVVQIGNDSGTLVTVLLRACAFTPLRQITVADAEPWRLGRAVATVEGALRSSSVLVVEGGGAAGAAEGRRGGGAASAGAGAEGQGPAAAGGVPPPLTSASGGGSGGGGGGGGAASSEGAPSFAASFADSSPTAPSAAAEAAPPPAAPAAGPGADSAAMQGGAPPAPPAAAAPAEAAWRAELSAFELDLSSPALASPGAWAAAGLGEPGAAGGDAGPAGGGGGCLGSADLVVLSEAVEQMASPGDAAEALAARVMRGLRPRVVLATTPNRDYNPVISELAGTAALRGPAGPGGAPLRHAPNRFELGGAEFGAWAAAVAAGAGDYDVSVFGLGRAAGDAATKAAAAAAGGGPPPAAGGGGAGRADGAAPAPEGASPAARLVADALARGAPGGAPGGQLPLPGVGFAQHAAVWVRRRGGAREGAAAVSAAAPAPLRRFWGPVVVAAVLPAAGEPPEGGGGAATPDVVEQF